MRNFMKYYKYLTLQGKVFYLLVITGMIFAAINTSINILLGLDIITVIASILTGILCLILLIYSRKTNNYSTASLIGFILLILFLYPSLWISNFGVRGPTPYFIIFNIILISIIMKKKNAFRLYTLHFITVIPLIYIDIKQPEMIINYSSSTVHTFDMVFSLFFVIIFTVVVVQRLMKEYSNRIVELNSLQEKFRKLSITDELTGIYNRRYIIQEINDNINKEVQIPFSIIMFDIDNFKKINDQYGHTFGDEVIKGVSNLLENHVRPIDIVGRIGGEEFLVVLMDTCQDEARIRANSMREEISQIDWSLDDFKVTVSGGVYTNMNEDTINDILEKVDQYLYMAKKSGKNIIV